MSKVFDLINKEHERQVKDFQLIASENYVSENVMKAQGSILTNKYAEGYPNKRYYGGCEVVDEIEQYAIDLAKKLFKVNYVNVQPHSGSQANAAAYLAILKPGDKVLAMDLNSGGHLTHGHQLSFSGITYDFYHYGVNKDTQMIDYEEIYLKAHEIKPKLIVAGASAYSKEIDFETISRIANEVGAYFMVDMAHIAGLVATGHHLSPIPYADIITTTTHKTLRGPRGGLIMTNNEGLAKKIDRAVFPGTQGGPLMHVIAAKAVALEEASTEEFKDYISQVVKTSKVMVDRFKELGAKIISDGTDNHMFMIDVKKSYNMTGLEAEKILGKFDITVNKNTIPFDTESPNKGSGIRIGTAAMCSRGMTESLAKSLASLIHTILLVYSKHGDIADDELQLNRDELFNVLNNRN